MDDNQFKKRVTHFDTRVGLAVRGTGPADLRSAPRTVVGDVGGSSTPLAFNGWGQGGGFCLDGKLPGCCFCTYMQSMI